MTTHNIQEQDLRTALEGVVAALDAAQIQECRVDGDRADVISAPPGSNFQNEYRLIARCATGDLWIKQAVAIAKSINFVRSLAAPPRPVDAERVEDEWGTWDTTGLRHLRIRLEGALANRSEEGDEEAVSWLTAGVAALDDALFLAKERDTERRGRLLAVARYEPWRQECKRLERLLAFPAHSPAHSPDKAVTREGVDRRALIDAMLVALTEADENHLAEHMTVSFTRNSWREVMGKALAIAEAALATKPTGTEAGRGVGAETDAERLGRIGWQMRQHGGVDSDDLEWMHEKALAATPVPPVSPSPDSTGQGDARGRIAEVVQESGGWWKSCSGCHETNEGQETGHYPYSDAFQCHVGAGCSECGGLGVVWEHYTDEQYAEMEAELSTPATVSQGDAQTQEGGR